MEFLSRTQVIAAFGAVLLALFVLDLVRRRRLSEEYALLWAVATTVMAVLGFSTPILKWITRVLGMMFESSTVFGVGLVFVILMLLYLSVQLSRLSSEHVALTRELALLRNEQERARPASRGEGA